MTQRTRWLLASALAIAAPALSISSSAPAPAVVLYDDRSIALDRVETDSTQAFDLWVRKTDLPRINEFELEPQGACGADVCSPVEKKTTRGACFNLTA